MATFAIYSYKLHKAAQIPEFDFPNMESYSKVELLESKQDYFQQIFQEDIDKKKLFECKNSNKRSKSPTIYESRILWIKDNIIVLQIANRRKKIINVNFTKKETDDFPWCNIIVDNRKDIQHIAIHNNNAFRSADIIAGILQHSFNIRLKQWGLESTIDPMYRSAMFWHNVKRFENVGIHQLRFDYDFPNPPWLSELIGDAVNEHARHLNGKPTLQYTAKKDGRLNLQKDDEHLQNLVRGAAGTGTDIALIPNGSHTVVHCKEDNKQMRVHEEMPDKFMQNWNDKDLFDTKHQRTIEFVNNIKLFYD